MKRSCWLRRSSLGTCSRTDAGVTTVEYTIIATAIAALLIPALVMFSGGVQGTFVAAEGNIPSQVANLAFNPGFEKQQGTVEVRRNLLTNPAGTTAQ